MARKLRIATLCSLAFIAILLVAAGTAYFAARQVRPFYQQALQLEPAELQKGSRELESRATALYSDARRAGQWSAVFTADQINGWLATQLTETHVGELPDGIRDPRVAISPDLLTLGFRTSTGRIETVASVDAAVFLTADGAVAIRLASVRAGALPLPVMQAGGRRAGGRVPQVVAARAVGPGGRPTGRHGRAAQRFVHRQAAVPHRRDQTGRRASVRGRAHGNARRGRRWRSHGGLGQRQNKNLTAQHLQIASREALPQASNGAHLPHCAAG
jgi:hypothetical protein